MVRGKHLFLNLNRNFRPIESFFSKQRVLAENTMRDSAQNKGCVIKGTDVPDKKVNMVDLD